MSEEDFINRLKEETISGKLIKHSNGTAEVHLTSIYDLAKYKFTSINGARKFLDMLSIKNYKEVREK